MQISTFNGNDTRPEAVFTATALSMVPGLGQIYNGEARKGLLFFCAGAVNLIFLSLILFKCMVLAGARLIGSSMHVRINPAVMDLLNNLDIRSPQMFVLCLLFFAFTLFCLQDAMEKRLLLRKQAIYSSQVLELAEATSGSYFARIDVWSMFLLVLFLLVPPETKNQITNIEFISPQPKAEKPVKSLFAGLEILRMLEKPKPNLLPIRQPDNQKSKINLRATRLRTQAINHPAARNSNSDLRENTSMDSAKQLKPNFSLAKAAPPTMPLPEPQTAPLKSAQSSVAPPLPVPTKTLTTAANTESASTAPGCCHRAFNFQQHAAANRYLKRRVKVLRHCFASAKSFYPGSNGWSFRAPVIQKAAQQSDGDAPLSPPVPSARSAAGRSSSAIGGPPSPKSAPAAIPGRASVAVGPAVPAVGASPSRGVGAVPPAGNNERAPSTESRPCLIMLNHDQPAKAYQKILKRLPKISDSNRVVVTFKIHTNGELSDLHLLRSSGHTGADNRLKGC